MLGKDQVKSVTIADGTKPILLVYFLVGTIWGAATLIYTVNLRSCFKFPSLALGYIYAVGLILAMGYGCFKIIRGDSKGYKIAGIVGLLSSVLVYYSFFFYNFFLFSWGIRLLIEYVVIPDYIFGFLRFHVYVGGPGIDYTYTNKSIALDVGMLIASLLAIRIYRREKLVGKVTGDTQENP